MIEEASFQVIIIEKVREFVEEVLVNDLHIAHRLSVREEKERSVPVQNHGEEAIPSS